MEAMMVDKVVKLAQGEETAIEKLRRLDEERAATFTIVKDAALKKANEAVIELNSLGLSFELVERGAKASGKAAGTCSVCNLRTQPAHDKRSHKNHPGAFTAEEIVSKGWKIVQ